MRAQHAHSLEAESAVLGGTLLHPTSVLPRVRALVDQVDFYHPAHAAIWEAIPGCDRRGEPIESVTVLEAMRRLDMLSKLNAVDGPAYLDTLMGQVVTVENVEHHARLVARKSERRRVQAQMAELAARGLSANDDDEGYLLSVEQAMLRLNAERKASGKLYSLRAALVEWQAELGERYERSQAGEGQQLVGVPTGFENLDVLTGGFRESDLIVLAARPSMGKTSLLVQILEGSAQRGTACLLFSLEMTRRQIVERMVSGFGRVDTVVPRNGTLSREDWVQVSQTATDLAERAIDIDDERGITISQLTSRARRWRATTAKDAKHAIIAVDYLGLIESDSSDQDANLNRQVTKITKALKTLAGNCGCPVIALSQLNRQVENRDDRHPRLSDLRDSGSIEQDADIVGLLYRDEVYDKRPANPHKGTAELCVGKFRGGPSATLWFDWQGRYTAFRSRWDEPDSKTAKPRHNGAQSATGHWQDGRDDDGGFV